MLTPINVNFYFKKNILFNYNPNPYKNNLCDVNSQPVRE